jgi:hypothetical protein
MRRYYEVLGISEDANEAEIKKGYRRASSRLHPDKIQSQREVTEEDTKAFQEVLEAYECLSDPERKATYDDTGDTGKGEDPVDGVLMHVFRTLLESGAPTAYDLLGTAKEVLSGMIEEASAKVKEFKAGLERAKKIKTKVEYKGKEKEPVLLRVIDDLILTLEIDIEDHEKAVAGAKMAYDKLRDYKPLDRSAKTQAKEHKEQEMPEHLRLLDSMLRGRLR